MGVRQHSASARRKRAGPAGGRLAALEPKPALGDARQDASDRAHVVAELEATFAYKEVPDEVLVGATVDLSVWSVVARDSCLLRLGGRPRGERWPQAVGASNQLADVLTQAPQSLLPTPTPMPTPAAIQKIDLSGAEEITDQALVTIGRLCPQLLELSVERATKLTDAGVRHVVSCCRSLRSLNLSHIPSLHGAALVAAAEVSLPLRELSVAGCAQIPAFAFQRLFLACPRLQALDVSSCGAVSDLVLLSLSQHCRQLRSLRLRHCRQVSDAGVVHVATGCSDLLTLDLSRCDLQYKLNDIALLSLAERCSVLQTVSLSGCEMLTDVGVSWLASGCHGVQHLDLSDCHKLGDMALRAIGEHLLQLRRLSLRHCARVTDMGLRHLALGCPELQVLDLTGLALLSDGSGAHPSADAEATGEPDVGAGVGALARRCAALRHLDLSRCVGIGDLTLRLLAAHSSQLGVLQLSGVVRVSSRGVRRLLQSCPQLSTLGLADCRAVDDHAFAFLMAGAGAHGVLHHLSVLRLRHCELVTDQTLRALAALRRVPLRELDLSGCARVTDLGVLALADSGVAPALRSLWLRDLVLLTETALAWLAERCPRLLLLDVTGCSRVRAFSLQALAPQWRFAVLSQDRAFTGLVPRHRAADRLVLEEYGDCWRAAIRLQCLYRARVARRVAAQRREEKLIRWVALRLQSVYRGRQARRLAVVARLQRRREVAAAVAIQTKFRQRLAVRSAAQRRAERLQAARERAAVCVQCAWRRKRLRDRLGARALRRLAEAQRRERAATQLQRTWRGKKTRERVSVLRAAKLARDREQREAAARLQNLYRARAARQEAQRRREDRREQRRREEHAAIRVQAAVRRRRAQRDLRRRREHAQRLSDAAVRIQRLWRARRRRQWLQLRAFTRRRQREHEAAVRLQAAWKRKQSRAVMRLLRVVEDERRQRELRAVVRVQTTWRAARARREVSAMKRAALERVLRQLRLETRSATLIQARVRGRWGRRRFQQLQLARKQQRWKELAQPDTGQRFFYNKETGEVRFRRPQDVLDLLPQPPCDNCLPPTPPVARIECRDCGEMFCEPCWRSVHAGGRRRDHAFRALYDFYGRRVDYGDGEFPSRWPSELQQDEMDGWFLRTYPHREPTETKGAWARYVDAASGREWFYNKDTGENSYVPPRGVFRPAASDADALARPTPRRDQLPTARSHGNDWAQYLDEATGYYYYYNHRTMESTYTRPAEFAVAREPSAAPLEQSADGWAKFVDPASGYAYYYNHLTQQSTYERPLTFLTPRAGDTPLETGADGWSKYLDRATGVCYYYHAGSQRSTFDRPLSFATPRVEPGRGQALERLVDGATQQLYLVDPVTSECRRELVTTARRRSALAERSNFR
ncbi:hypothetical protein ATCC90586_002575 [Pythium insidiosum]|nr:hypothetical protein ATCC90586_002575 [Pythium insidiosum]